MRLKVRRPLDLGLLTHKVKVPWVFRVLFSSMSMALRLVNNIGFRFASKMGIGLVVGT